MKQIPTGVDKQDPQIAQVTWESKNRGGGGGGGGGDFSLEIGDVITLEVNLVIALGAHEEVLLGEGGHKLTE